MIALAAVAATVSLGQWQQGRAEYKTALAEQYEARGAEPAILLPPEKVDPAALEFRHVLARGEFLKDRGFLLDNQVFKGVAGYHVITPLRIDGSAVAVLVDRGWVAAGRSRSDPPAVRTDPGIRSVEGIAAVPNSRFVELREETRDGPFRQNIVLDRLERELGIPLQPIVIRQTSASDDELVREWALPDVGVDKHRAYALQWYCFAALAVVLYVVLNLKRVPTDAD
jgi:surfeit locus 1 family protein